MPPAFTLEALHQLRDPTLFQWYAIPILGGVFYVYAVEIERRNWSAVLAGLAFWGADWLNEIVNALVLHFTGTAAIWTTTGPTAFQFLIGLNFEICTLFSVAGIIFVKQLPADPAKKILGVPNRWLFVAGYSIFSVVVELFLHWSGRFHWAYSWWNEHNPELIVIFGYGTFYACAAWVYDTKRLRTKIAIASTLLGVAATGLIVFGAALRWI